MSDYIFSKTDGALARNNVVPYKQPEFRIRPIDVNKFVIDRRQQKGPVEHWERGITLEGASVFGSVNGAKQWIDAYRVKEAAKAQFIRDNPTVEYP